MAKDPGIPGSTGTPAATQPSQAVVTGRRSPPGRPTESYLQVGPGGGPDRTTRAELDARLAAAAAERAAQAAADAAAGAAVIESARAGVAGLFGSGSTSSRPGGSGPGLTEELAGAYDSPGAGGPGGPGTGYQAGGGLTDEQLEAARALTPVFWLGVAAVGFGGWWFFGKKKRKR